MMASALIDKLTYRSHVLDMNIPDASHFSLNAERKGRQANNDYKKDLDAKCAYWFRIVFSRTWSKQRS